WVFQGVGPRKSARDPRMDLHLRIPAERWCITIKEFREFVADVNQAWRGQLIPDNPQHPDPGHWNRRLGPNLHQVNEHYVKPVTLKAGGMSYALMKHPEGLPCQVFVSHAWLEGVFELADLLKRAWPPSRHLSNLYLCLLANPQNLNIETLLTSPRQSPFALALATASHLLVIPNSHTSIYKRLWCVYEAYLGTVMDKVCLMPAKPESYTKWRTAAWSILLPFSTGFAVGLLWLFGHLALHWRAPQVAFWMMHTGLAMSLVGLSCSTFATLFGNPNLQTVAWLLHVGDIFLTSTLQMPWIFHPVSLEPRERILHYLAPFGQCLLNMTRVHHINQQHLEGRELARQASHLHISSLDDATCTSLADEQRIRRAIAGAEEDVVTTIRVLMKAGAYTKSLRQAHEAGVDITGAGSMDVSVSFPIAAFLWLWCFVRTLSCLKWRDAGCPESYWMLDMSIVVMALAVLAMPLLLRMVRGFGPEWVIFGVDCWGFCGGLAVVVPSLMAAIDSHFQVGALPSSALRRDAYDTLICPKAGTWYMVVVFRPFMAVLADLVTILGPARVHALVKRRKCPVLDRPERLSSDSDSESSSSGSAPGAL
ncbi:unnamed protein product, partial [Effrenium voratum]